MCCLSPAVCGTWSMPPEWTVPEGCSPKCQGCQAWETLVWGQNNTPGCEKSVLSLGQPSCYCSGHTCLSFSRVWLFAAEWTVACQAPLPMDFPGKNTGVGCHAFLQGIFSTQGSSPGFLHCRQIVSHLRHQQSSDAGKDGGQEEKRVPEDEMVGWHHRLNGPEFEQTRGDSGGQGSLVCCSSWSCKYQTWPGFWKTTTVGTCPRRGVFQNLPWAAQTVFPLLVAGLFYALLEGLGTSQDLTAQDHQSSAPPWGHRGLSFPWLWACLIFFRKNDLAGWTQISLPLSSFNFMTPVLQTPVPLCKSPSSRDRLWPPGFASCPFPELRWLELFIPRDWPFGIISAGLVKNNPRYSHAHTSDQLKTQRPDLGRELGWAGLLGEELRKVVARFEAFAIFLEPSLKKRTPRRPRQGESMQLCLRGSRVLPLWRGIWEQEGRGGGSGSNVSGVSSSAIPVPPSFC